MPGRVRITDVSPRDGLQNEAAVIPTSDKVALIEALCETGLDEVEITSFVSPKWVPQLGDAEEVCAGVREFVEAVRHVAGTISRRQTPSPSGGGLGRGAAFRYPKAKPPKKTAERARTLRNHATGPERALWSRLSHDRIRGLRFRRQHRIGPYIVDFYCAAAALVIELDGKTHEGEIARANDEARDRYLRSLGLKVIRFTNDEVLSNLDGVVTAIDRTLHAPLPGPPPEGEGVRLPPDSGLPVFSVLVPNEKGFERAMAVRDAGLPLKVSVFTAASETFSKKNTNATIAETIERFRAFVPRALGEGMEVRAYISCAVACPFEGPIAPDAVRRVADLLRGLASNDDERAALELDLGDTIGVATEEDIERLLDAFEDIDPLPLTLHLHDTFGRASDCVALALEMGVRSFDGSVAGLGGCPYASTPEKRAPGNISTETLVSTVWQEGYDTGVDEERLAQVGQMAREMIARARTGGAP